MFLNSGSNAKFLNGIEIFEFLCYNVKGRRKDMNLITIDTFEENELHKFVKNAFKDRTVPEDLEEFKACFSCDTTDGSPCFAKEFGEGEDDAVMLFFYPFHCAVPPRYHKNLRDERLCNVCNLVLDYQSFLAKHSNNLHYLESLRDVIEQRHEINVAAIEFDLSRHFSCSRMEEDHIDENLKARGESALEEDLIAYTKKFEETKAFVDDKIATLSHKTHEEKEKSLKPLPKERDL